MDLQPDKAAYLLKLLLELPESIPPGQFQEYIELQKSQIEKSKEEIERLEQRIVNQISLGQSCQGSKSTKKSFEECCYQGDRHFDKQRLNRSFDQRIENHQKYTIE